MDKSLKSMMTLWKSGVYHLLAKCQAQTHHNGYKVLSIRVFVTKFPVAVLYPTAELLAYYALPQT